jgi:hypothetical protein
MKQQRRSVAGLLLVASICLGLPAEAVEVGPQEKLGEAAPTLPVPVPQRTLAKVPSGVDTYSALVDGSTLGAAGVGLVDGRTKEAGGSKASGGVRVWTTFLDRFLAQAEAGNDAKQRFVPSLTLAARALGDRKRGWAAGVLARYRTEGFATVDGEIEGGLLGAYARHRLHLDAGLVVGVGIWKRSPKSAAFRSRNARPRGAKMATAPDLG